jgi:hypothetical protein
MPSSIHSVDDGWYADGYPGEVDNPRAKDNLRFYSNEIKCRPDGTILPPLSQSILSLH